MPELLLELFSEEIPARMQKRAEEDLARAVGEKLKSHGLKGLVVWALEENANALAFYAGAGGRDVAEGVEVFDQKAIRKVAFVWD